MKLKITLLNFIIGFSFTYGQLSSSCNVNSTLTNYYSEEIRSLAVDYMLEDGINPTSVTVPVAQFNYIAKGLTAIFESSLAERDSIFDMYCVHQYSGLNSMMNKKRIIVYFNTSASWTTNWINGLQTTGNSVIDNLIISNNLTVSSYHYYPDFPDNMQHSVILSSPVVINSTAAINILTSQPGVTIAEVDYWLGGSGTMSFYLDLDNKMNFIISHQWNDCYDDCDEFIEWHFKVDTNCNVVLFNRTEGHFDVITTPQSTNCNITLENISFANNVKIVAFPNPIQDMVLLNIPLAYRNATITLYNTVGEKIHQSTTDTNDYYQLNTSNLSKGVYFFKIEGYHEIIKVIK